MAQGCDDFFSAFIRRLRPPYFFFFFNSDIHHTWMALHTAERCNAAELPAELSRFQRPHSITDQWELGPGSNLGPSRWRPHMPRGHCAQVLSTAAVASADRLAFSRVRRRASVHSGGADSWRQVDLSAQMLPMMMVKYLKPSVWGCSTAEKYTFL